MAHWFDSQATAVVSFEFGDAGNIASFLNVNGLRESPHFTPDKVDDLNKEVIDGRVRQVVFESFDQALQAIWNGDIDYGEWVKRGIQLHFITPPPIDPVTALGAMNRSWQTWNSQRVRRNAIAGVWFSITALVVAFVLSAALAAAHR